MSKNYKCEKCNKNYASYSSLWTHNKKFHILPQIEENKKISCKYCNKLLSCKQSKWCHEQKCKNKTQISLEEKVKQLSEDIKEIKAIKPNNVMTNNNNNNKTINNNNIQYVINAPTASSLDHLTFEVQKEVLDKGLNSLVCLIELLNFNKDAPENHSYCITAINDKHASVIDEKTNKVVKTNKFDLFDKVLGSNLENLEKLAINPKFTSNQKEHYKGKINYLKTMMFQNNKFIKRYQNDINLIGYNNKDMIKETWKSLKDINQLKGLDNEILTNDDEEEAEYYGDRPKGFDDLIDELPEDQKPDFLKKPIDNTPKSSNALCLDRIAQSDDESDDESEYSDDETNEYVEIKVKGQMYILEGTKIYTKTKKGTKGEYYGSYINGKIKKRVKNEIDV